MISLIETSPNLNLSSNANNEDSKHLNREELKHNFLESIEIIDKGI